MNHQKQYWLYLDSYVHVFLAEGHYLVYNTLTGEAIEGRNNPSIYGLLERLNSDEGLYVALLDGAELADREIGDFVRRIRMLFMGDLADRERFSGKIFQIPPRLKVIRDLEDYKKARSWEEIGAGAMSNLTELSIYINSGVPEPNRFLEQGRRQFLFPIGERINREIPFVLLSSLLQRIPYDSLHRLNVLGGDVFAYSEWDALLILLEKAPGIKAFHFTYTGLAEREKTRMRLEGLPHVEINIWVYPPFNTQILDAVIPRTAAMGFEKKPVFHFVLENEEDFSRVEELIGIYQVEEYSFRPFYNGSNLDFFREAVFLDRESILGGRPSQRDIFARQVLNQNFFGKMTVMPDGNIFTNTNLPPVGDLNKILLHDAVYMELSGSGGWTALRGKLHPCRECVFQTLCPSPSQYESVIGRNNLCNIWEESGPKG